MWAQLIYLCLCVCVTGFWIWGYWSWLLFAARQSNMHCNGKRAGEQWQKGKSWDNKRQKAIRSSDIAVCLEGAMTWLWYRIQPGEAFSSQHQGTLLFPRLNCPREERETFKPLEIFADFHQLSSLCTRETLHTANKAFILQPSWFSSDLWGRIWFLN